MNRSLLALAAVASFTGTANAKDMFNLIPPNMVASTTTPVVTTHTTDAGKIPSEANTSGVTVLGELPVLNVSLACGCYPNRCSD